MEKVQTAVEQSKNVSWFPKKRTLSAVNCASKLFSPRLKTKTGRHGVILWRTWPHQLPARNPCRFPTSLKTTGPTSRGFSPVSLIIVVQCFAEEASVHVLHSFSSCYSRVCSYRFCARHVRVTSSRKFLINRRHLFGDAASHPIWMWNAEECCVLSLREESASCWRLRNSDGSNSDGVCHVCLRLWSMCCWGKIVS